MSEKKTFQQNAEARRMAEFVSQKMTTRCCMCRWNSGELSSSEAHAAFEAHLTSAHPNFEPRRPARKRGAKGRPERHSRRPTQAGHASAAA